MRILSNTICVLASVLLCADSTGMGEEWLTYFGTYTGAESQGIYVSRFDSETGKFTAPELAVDTKSPSFLAVHPGKTLLYAVSEVADYDGKPTGAVSAFEIQRPSGHLLLVNQQASGGKGPCHLDIDAKGKGLLAANYGSGSVAALPILADGSLGPAASTIQHSGSSINPKRQTGPHAHQAVFAPGNRYALVCDLGLDQVLVYKPVTITNATPGKGARTARPAQSLKQRAAASQPDWSLGMTPSTPSFFTIQPGSGPRHLAFRPDGKFVYLINELNSTMMAFSFNRRIGSLDYVQTVATIPPGTEGDNWCGEVQVHPNSRFVYGSNRGHDSIAVFSADQQSGKLSPIQHVASGGKFPRFIAIDPSGRWLLSLNQNSSNAVLFSIDPRTGKLAETGSSISIGSPVCAVFVPVRVGGKGS